MSPDAARYVTAIPAVFLARLAAVQLSISFPLSDAFKQQALRCGGAWFRVLAEPGRAVFLRPGAVAVNEFRIVFIHGFLSVVWDNSHTLAQEKARRQYRAQSFFNIAVAFVAALHGAVWR